MCLYGKYTKYLTEVVTETLVLASRKSRISLALCCPLIHSIFRRFEKVFTYLIATSALSDLFLFIANSFSFIYVPLSPFYCLVGCLGQCSIELGTEEAVHSFYKYVWSAHIVPGIIQV